MQKRHTDSKMYFEEQVYTTRRYVIPFIEQVTTYGQSTKVLEVGCGQGGNLVPFLEKNCLVTGVDISENKIEAARELFKDHQGVSRLKLLAKDIYDAEKDLDGLYDLIIMRDVIEHIHDQDRYLGFIKKYLKPDGFFFVAFPPWYNPFGGHQQICANKLLSKLPYFHLLPRNIYRFILKSFGEPDQRIEALLEIKDTGISIERFHRITRKHGYSIVKSTYFLVNPNYEVKYRLKPRKQFTLITGIPFIKDLLTTSYYCILSKG